MKRFLLILLLIFSYGIVYAQFYNDNFTYKFKDDFESWTPSTIGGWTTRVQSAGIVSTTTVVSKYKTYSLMLQDNSTTQTDVYLTKSLAGYTTTYYRFYLKFPTGFFWETSRMLFSFIPTGGSRTRLYANKSGQTGYLRLGEEGPSGGLRDSEILKEDRWYCFEVYLPSCTANTTIRWWLDNVEQTSIPTDLSTYGNWATLNFGMQYTNTAVSTNTIYFDQFVASTQRIGMIKKRFPINTN